MRLAWPVSWSWWVARNGGVGVAQSTAKRQSRKSYVLTAVRVGVGM